MEEKEVKKRRGYKTKEQQNEAMKRYYNNNPDAKLKKTITTAKGQCKKFIKEFATLEELQEIKMLIKSKEEKMKIYDITKDEKELLQEIKKDVLEFFVKEIKKSGWLCVSDGLNPIYDYIKQSEAYSVRDVGKLHNLDELEEILDLEDIASEIEIELKEKMGSVYSFESMRAIYTGYIYDNEKYDFSSIKELEKFFGLNFSDE